MRFERLWKDESGPALVIATLSLAVLMGFLALAVDVGLLFHARRNVQLAADSAAVAAALDYKYNANVTSARSAGRAAATANGISNVASTVRVNIPPANGTFATGAHGGGNYAEVIIRQPMSTTFTNFLNVTNLSITGRAVAGPAPLNEAGEGCIWALSGTGSAVSISGTGNITASNCNVYDDSTAGNALRVNGGGSISAKAIGVVGGSSPTGTGAMTSMTPVANPVNLTAPTPPTTPCPGGCVQNFTGGSHTLTPGRYTSISVTGSARVTFGAGQYIVEGGSPSPSLTLSPNGTGRVIADRVTFYVTGGAAIGGAGGNLAITAPANGVALFEEDSSAVTITANTGMTFDGIVYAPAAPLTLAGSGATISTDFIVNSLDVTGGPNTISNYAVITNTNSVLNKIRMME
jgi:Flp pilus assembly protein TadG